MMGQLATWGTFNLSAVAPFGINVDKLQAIGTTADEFAKVSPRQAIDTYMLCFSATGSDQFSAPGRLGLMSKLITIAGPGHIYEHARSMSVYSVINKHFMEEFKASADMAGVSIAVFAEMTVPPSIRTIEFAHDISPESEMLSERAEELIETMVGKNQPAFWDLLALKDGPSVRSSFPTRKELKRELSQLGVPDYGKWTKIK